MCGLRALSCFAACLFVGGGRGGAGGCGGESDCANAPTDTSSQKHQDWQRFDATVAWDCVIGNASRAIRLVRTSIVTASMPSRFNRKPFQSNVTLIGADNRSGKTAPSPPVAPGGIPGSCKAVRDS